MKMATVHMPRIEVLSPNPVQCAMLMMCAVASRDEVCEITTWLSCYFISIYFYFPYMVHGLLRSKAPATCAVFYERRSSEWQLLV